MINNNLYETITYLFERKWDSNIDNDTDEYKLQNIYNATIEKYGWDKTFAAIDNYMRSNCTDGFSANNFALWFSFYRCCEVGKIKNPYYFLGYLYYRMDLEPWKYDALDIMDSLVKDIFFAEGDKTRDPYWNEEYKPEKDPNIVAEVEKLRKAGK